MMNKQIAFVLSLVILCPLVQASGPNALDNNWQVDAVCLEDADKCCRLVSIERSKGADGKSLKNLAASSRYKKHPGDIEVTAVKCINPTKNAQCGAYKVADMQAQPALQGCTYKAHADNKQVTHSGVWLLDRLCYNNFITKQVAGNGGAGWAPDKSRPISEVEFHTRGCILIDYCVGMGFTLLSKDAVTNEYKLDVVIEAGDKGAQVAYDWLSAEDIDNPKKGTAPSADGAMISSARDGNRFVISSVCAIVSAMVMNA